jgi:hypothetical protein
MSSVRTIAISEDLCRAAEQHFAGRFSTLDELVTELLQRLLSENASAMDQEEQLIIEERLKSLGYV